MKNMILISFAFFLMTSSCDKIMETKYAITVQNKTDKDILITAGCSKYAMSIYPDTTLPATKPSLFYVESKNNNYLPHSFKWKDVIAKLPSDTLSVYIFSSDTVDAYDWSIIASKYKILKRYDLSIEDLERINWTITYP